jgi:peptide/nickel transport system permease protein
MPPALATWLRRHKLLALGGLLVGAMILLAVIAPLIAGDPISLQAFNRNKPPSDRFWFGTDNFGRDVYNRTVFGARVSLLVGAAVAALSLSIGVTIGLVAGFDRRLDAVVMRIMDGLMAIPGVLLAISLIALAKPSVAIVILAITIPEVPRVVRLVRSLVLSVREQPYIEAEISAGTPRARILRRHVLPNIVPPLIVQGTYVCASAILIEAGLSFLGAGTPAEIPTWGNMIASGRSFFQLAPWMIFFPGACLAITVLGINLLGDGLRDSLDPRIAKRL